MFATKPSVRATAALLALLGAAPALAQDREPPPEPWYESARPDDDDDRPRPPPARDERDAARPAPPAGPGPYYPARPAYRARHRHPGYAPAYPPAPAPGYGPGYGPRQAYLWPRVEVALRGGVAAPGGNAVEGVPMRDLFGNQLTLGLDVGLRASPHLYMGLFAEGGLGLGGDLVDGACRTGTHDCGAASGRLGAAIHYHFAPYAPLDPWLGYGVAISGATVSGSDAFGTFDRSFAGFEYAKLMAGVDMRLAGSATLGLYAEWTSGVFSQVEAKEDGVVVDSGSVGGTTTHSWFTVGPRLKF
jgi:hypothetical protein